MGNARKKFEIINAEPPYQPQERNLPNFTTIASLNSSFEQGDPKHHRLYLTREAMDHIASHIGWGQMTQHNCIEQGGILLGQVFRDNERGVTYGVVKAAVAGLSARGSSVHLEMTHETWREMLNSADQLLEKSPHTELCVIGWYHTHPNGLQVFMSGTDRETQRRLFALDWQFAIVLNPQKSQWRAFFGGNADECKGYVLAEDQRALVSEVVSGPESVASEEDAPEVQAEGEVVPHVQRKTLGPLRVWIWRPRILLRACMLSLFIVMTLQLLTIGMLVGTFFWRR